MADGVAFLCRTAAPPRPSGVPELEVVVLWRLLTVNPVRVLSEDAAASAIAMVGQRIG